MKTFYVVAWKSDCMTAPSFWYFKKASDAWRAFITMHVRGYVADMPRALRLSPRRVVVAL